MLNKLKLNFNNLDASGKRSVAIGSGVNIGIILAFTIMTGNPYLGNLVYIWEIICWIGVVIAFATVSEIKNYDLPRAIKEDTKINRHKDNFTMKMSNYLTYSTIGISGIIGGDFSLFFIYGLFNLLVLGINVITHEKMVELEKIESNKKGEEDE
jgi:hypothetical protein